MRARLRALAAAVVLVAGCAGDAGDAAFHAADSLRVLGRFADALPRYAALRDSLAGSADSAARWRAQVGWAETLLRTGRLDTARVALDDARVLARGDSLRLARTRYVRSLLLHRQGKLDSALSEAAAALAVAQARRDPALAVDAFSVHGTVHSLSGRYRLAAAHAESALAIERTLTRPVQYLATRLNNLGVEYRRLGRLGDAERVFLEGLELARGLPSPRTTMLLSANLGHLRDMTGNRSEVLRLREAVLRAADELQDVQGLTMGNTDLGELYLQQGNAAAARRHFTRSLELNTPVRYTYARITALWGLGDVALLEGAPARGVGELRDALRLADAGGWGTAQAGIRVSLSRAALAARDARTALRWADEALRLADSVDDLRARVQALEARGAAREALRPPDGPEEFLAAIDLLESWRGRIAMGDLRAGVADRHWSLYEGAIRSLLARGDATGAFTVAERARARLLLELLAERDASRPAATAPQRLRDRIRVLAEERAEAPSEAARRPLDAELAAAIDSLAELERRAQAGDATGAVRYPAPAPLPDIAARLAPPGRVLLTYFWGERDVYGWSLSADGLRARRLGPADSLAALVDFLRAALESPAAAIAWEPPAARARAALLAPLLPAEPAEVVVVPDGPLTHLPFEVLLGPAARVTYGPSASVLLALAAGQHRDWSRTALVVGDPAVPRGSGDGSRAELGPLPFAAAEARTIHALFRPAADLLVRGAATRARWQALDPSRYRYLHFAAHALVSDREPARTHIVLADGGLDLAGIRRVPLTAELVTLSACETALGLRVRGEGVIGLPHAFLAAGARGVVVTLWRVDDQAAADLMTDFYRHVAAGRPPAEALRAAREQRRGEHPSRWAAFVLVGAPR